MKLALALGGGAGLGWAHIGVLRALEEAGIEIGAAAGTSIGALAAVCLAAERLDVLEDMARTANLRTVLRYLDPHLKSGAVLGGREIARQLEQHLGHARFESLAIPAAAVAADLLTGEGCIIDHGSVAPAVRASMAVPGVFFPVDIDGRLLVDGGAVMPVPVEAARRLAPGLPVLAINLLGDYHARAYRVRDRWAERKTLSAFGVMRASAGLMLAHLTKQSLELCPPDLELSLPVGHIEPGNFTRASELILIGRMATQEALPKIEALVAA